MNAFRRRWVWSGLAIAAMVVIAIGIILTQVDRASPSFGWFAYAPLASQTFNPAEGMIVLTPLVVVGLALTFVGGLGLAFFVGYVIGRIARPVRQHVTSSSARHQFVSPSPVR